MKQMPRFRDEELKSVLISNFSLGYVKETDSSALEKNTENSVSDVLNMEIDKVNGEICKRNGISSNNQRFAVLPVITNYHVKKLFEFIGPENSLIQLSALKYNNSWKILYRKRSADLSNEPSWTSITNDWLDTPVEGNSLVAGNDPAVLDAYTLNTGEEPYFDVVDGACRIGLGQNNDPLIICHSEREKYFRYRTYQEADVDTDVDTIARYANNAGCLLTQKRWIVRRQVPDILSRSPLSVDATSKVQGRDGVYPWWKLVVTQSLCSFIRNNSENKKSWIKFKVADNYVQNNRLAFWQIEFNRWTSTHSESGGTLTVGCLGIDAVYDSELQRSGGAQLKYGDTVLWLAKKIEEAAKLDSIMLPLLDASPGRKYNETFSIGAVLYNNPATSVPEGHIMFAMTNFGSAQGSDYSNATTVAKWYVPQPPTENIIYVYSDENTITQRGLPSKIGDIWGYQSSTEYTIYANDILNPSSNLKKGLYEFKFTFMFGNEETIPIGKSVKVHITNTTQKVGLRFTANTSYLNDTRFNRMNIYVKRTIPITQEMKPTERNEALQYTDIDYRLAKTIDLVVHDQQLRDIDRANTGSAIGSQPMIWQYSGGIWFIDFVYSDLISDTMLEQAQGQDDYNGFLLNNLGRDEDDEGIVRYKGAVYHQGRRYVYGVKKKKSTKTKEWETINDRIYFSLITPNLDQRDIFSNTAWANAGNGDIVLYGLEWRSKLILFTETNMYFLDIAMNGNKTSNGVDDITIIDAFTGSGCPYPNTVVANDMYVIWANNHSVWLWSGQTPIDLLSGRWKEEYRTLGKTDMFAAICNEREYYMLHMGSIEQTFDTIKVFSVNGNAWTSFGFSGEQIIDNMFNDLKGGLCILLRDTTSAVHVYPTEVYYDVIGTNKAEIPYISKFNTQQLATEGDGERDYQTMAISYSATAGLYASFLQPQDQDTDSYLVKEIKLKQTTQYRRYVTGIVNIPVAASNNLEIEIGDYQLFAVDGDVGANDVRVAGSVEPFSVKWMKVTYTDVDDSYDNGVWQ